MSVIAEQSVAGPPQLPPVQVSGEVQGSLSAQLVPSGRARATHDPLDGSHTPAVHMSSIAVQSVLTPAHAPATQASMLVQGLPSSHEVLSGRGADRHSPVGVSQTPTVQSVS